MNIETNIPAGRCEGPGQIRGQIGAWARLKAGAR